MLGRKKQSQLKLTPLQQKAAQDHLRAGTKGMFSIIIPFIFMVVPIGRKRRAKKIKQRYDKAQDHLAAATAILEGRVDVEETHDGVIT